VVAGCDAAVLILFWYKGRMKRGRPKKPLELSVQEREVLEAVSRQRKAGAAEVVRAVACWPVRRAALTLKLRMHVGCASRRWEYGTNASGWDG
jgi:hypothetical protein